MLDEVGTVAREHVDNGNLDHGVASGLQTHRGASHVNQYLTRKGGVVDLHVELKTLVLGLTANTLAHQVNTMAHVANIVNALYLEHVGLVRSEVGVGLDVLTSPKGMVMLKAFLTPFFERTHTLWPIDIPGPKLV